MTFEKITERSSLYDNLDKMSVAEIVNSINTEDRKVAEAVGKAVWVYWMHRRFLLPSVCPRQW